MSDEQRLAELGYKQELRRKLSGFSNFAISFSIISILAGAITSYGIAMTAGGPLAITLGWLFVGGMVTLVALAMAEVCSVYPTAGALYWWSYALAKRNKAAWAWFVGWFNFLGEVAVTAAIDFGAAITTSAYISLTFGVEVTALRTFGIFLIIIVLHAPVPAPGRRPDVAGRPGREDDAHGQPENDVHPAPVPILREHERIPHRSQRLRVQSVLSRLGIGDRR